MIVHLKSLWLLVLVIVRMRMLKTTPKKFITMNFMEELQEKSLNTRKVIVYGNTSHVQPTHPVIQSVLERYEMQSLPGKRSWNDDKKIALCIEGGGMRGCTAAGAAAAINFLGLNDCIDVVYGSSAGSMVAAYFVSRQVSGVRIYHDLLTSAGNKFINKKNLIKAAGLDYHIIGVKKHLKNWLIKLRPTVDRNATNFNTSFNPAAAIVFNLDFLLNQVMFGMQPLDWETFSKNERVQPLHIVCSSVSNFSTVSLTRSEGSYIDLPSLLECIRASMLVPGIAGHLMGISSDRKTPFPIRTRESVHHDYHPLTVEDVTASRDASIGRIEGTNAWTTTATSQPTIVPIADAFLCEPMPYREAVRNGATHVIMLRTRPDPCEVLGKGPGIYERLIASRYFRQYSEHRAVSKLLTQEHHKIYAQDVIILNEASKGHPEGISIENRHVHILPVAVQSTDADSQEVGQLETRKEIIYAGMRAGARRVLSIFLPSMLKKMSQDRLIFFEGNDKKAVRYSLIKKKAIHSRRMMALSNHNFVLEHASELNPTEDHEGIAMASDESCFNPKQSPWSKVWSVVQKAMKPSDLSDKAIENDRLDYEEDIDIILDTIFPPQFVLQQQPPISMEEFGAVNVFQRGETIAVD